MSQPPVVHRAAPVRLRGDDVDIPPALLQVGGPGLLVVILWWALAKGWLVTSREVDDVRTQRDKADTRAAQALDIVAAQADALREHARKQDLASEAMQAIARKATGAGEH